MGKVLLFAVLLTATGCSSFRTSAVDRVENDMLVVNPDCPMKGVPVSLRVPSHLELCVVETTYWEKVDEAGKKPTLAPLHTCRPTRSVSHDICYTEKIFLVDPVRPGAGLQNYGFEFQSSGDAAKKEDAGKGYLKNVTYMADDRTITESASLLANSLGLINALQTSANAPNQNTANLVSTDRTVAFGRFDINSPTYEMDVAAFLDCYVNCAPGNGPCPDICKPEMCKKCPAAK